MKTYQTIHLIARHVCKEVFAICLFLLGGVANAWASESRDTINGLVYTLDENTMTAQLTSAADKNITNANIVEKIVNDKGTFRVTAIGYRALFRLENLESVTIPPSVTTIGEYGICGNPCLTTLTIPSSITKMESGALSSNTVLVSVRLSENLTELPDGCFAFCSMLKSIKIPLKVRRLGRECFTDCKNLKTVEVLSEDFSIDGLCFLRCHLETFVNHSKTPQPAIYTETAHYGDPPQFTNHGQNLYVPKESVTAYKNAELWKDWWVNIKPLEEYVEEEDDSPWSLEKQSDGRYYVAGMYFTLDTEEMTASFVGVNTGFYSLGLPGEGDPSQMVGYVNIPGYVYYQSKEYTVTSLGKSCLCGYMYLNTVRIPSTVRDIGGGCFVQSGPANLIIPEGVTVLGKGCFASSFISKIDVASSVDTMGDYCFQDCMFLSSVILRSPNLMSISKGCFEESYRLSELVCYANQVPTLEYDGANSPFYHTNAGEGTLYVRKELVETFKATPGWNEWGTILPIYAYGTVDAIGRTAIDEKDAAIYDLQGRRVETPQKNRLYIKNGKKFVGN